MPAHRCTNCDASTEEMVKWPSAYSAFRNIVEAYIGALTRLGEDFPNLVIGALSLPAYTFRPFLSDQHPLKLVRYSGCPDGSQGVGPHKDSSGWWNCLLQASSPHVTGLQILNRNGDWIIVPNIPGTFVVSISQGLKAVIDGVYKATTYHVLFDP